MANKMLIDASHPEETRVVVVRGNRIEEFDFESQSKKQLKGNIYLARVTRVEPSLQAAFVEYGGNRHGFLAFSEIHPDYYQIPVADRQALLAAEAAESDDEEDADSDRQENGRRRRRRGGRARGQATTNGAEDAVAANADGDVVSEPVDGEDAGPAESAGGDVDGDGGSDDHDDDHDNGNGANGHDDTVEMVGAEDALDELPSRRRLLRRNYKIQEVIKRRQIMLVQVVKEERGNKGAALTTYLSLAGRYAVLMPNTARGGGISRKITNAADRKRLKDIVADLDVPKGMGVILRTAGANRTRAEVKRDYEYLMRLWMRIRDTTLKSTAPALVHEEGSLIKRSVRDLYNKDIDQILVSGEDAYREAKDFMRMLMPSHAKVVQPYRDPIPILARNGIEAQLDRMLQPQVTLKSGGYIIINQTEALVAIDVNSGRSTREHSIESTALQTNLEAAEEVARQLRLRDLAGLIVIDFIDMEEKRNNRAVEKRLKECLKNDRARIQVGRISHFGLLEMSRQRIRASVLESTMQPCQHCHGTGFVRSQSSLALHVLRGIEEFLIKDASHDIIVRTPASTALYVLNHKRTNLIDLENRFGLSIRIEADETLGTQHFGVVKGEPASRTPAPPPPPAPEEEEEVEEVVETAEETDAAEAEATPAAAAAASEDGGIRKKRRRRRRRRGGQNRDGEGNRIHHAGEDGEDGDADGDESFSEGGDEESGEPDESGVEADTEPAAAEAVPVSEAPQPAAEVEPAAPLEEAEAEAPAKAPRQRRSRRKVEAAEPVAEAEAPVTDAPVSDADPVPEVEAEPVKKPARKRAAASRKPRAARSENAEATQEPAANKAAHEPEAAAPVEAEGIAAEVEATAVGPDLTPAATAETEAVPLAPLAENRPRLPDTTEPVVTSNVADESAPAQPKKLGWWRRRGIF